MPRKPKDPKVDVNANRKYFCASEAEWGGYINLKVNEDERSDFDGWQVEESANVSDLLAYQIVEGLKLSVGYDADNSSYLATFTGAGCVGTKLRCCLTARSDDLFEAINLLLYKHVVLLDSDWSSYRPATGRSSFG